MLWGYELASLPPSATFFALLLTYFSPTVLHELCRFRVSFQDIRIARIFVNPMVQRLSETDCSWDFSERSSSPSLSWVL